MMFSFLLAATLALTITAQTAPPPDVKNPRSVEFTCSADHTALDSYELDIIKPDGVTVLQTLNLGKMAPSAVNLCTAPINVQPVAFGKGYSVRVRAKAGTSTSDDAVSLNKFERAPGPTGPVVIK